MTSAPAVVAKVSVGGVLYLVKLMVKLSPRKTA